MAPADDERLIEYRLAQLEGAIARLSEAAASMATTVARMDYRSSTDEDRFERIEKRLDDNRNSVRAVATGVVTTVLAAIVVAVLVKAGVL